MKSSLDLNPALNLEWVDVIQIAKEFVDKAFWLRFKNSKVMVHYSPFWLVSHTTLKKDPSTKELIYKDRAMLKAWSHDIEYCDDFLVDLDWDELEAAIVPSANDVQGWATLTLEDDPDGKYEFIYRNAPKDIDDWCHFLDNLDESQLVILWPADRQDNTYFMAGEPYFHCEGEWRSMYLLNRRDEYCDVQDFTNGDKWLPMFVR